MRIGGFNYERFTVRQVKPFGGERGGDRGGGLFYGSPSLAMILFLSWWKRQSNLKKIFKDGFFMVLIDF